jgi:hypothetical protein
MPSYVEVITQETIRLLDRASELHGARVAGYAANLDFWVSEVEHRLHLIATYPQRFERMRSATRDYESDQDLTNKRVPDDLPTHNRQTTRTFKSAQQKEIRKELMDSIEKFLARCSRLGLVSEENLVEHCGTLGIDPRVIKEWA